MGHKLINIETATIHKITRKDGDAQPYEVIQVVDEEGEERFLFPPVLAIAEVKSILREINYAYDKGYETGELRRSRDICKLLAIKPEAFEND
ncbi:hypothetical protein QMM96_22075 [Citrobacter freundii]|uniref:hypothetical protein n=1 Tax=Citrobacter freundii TaxID=546 RepID=UPI002B24CEA3|nr:hypothetical protein [Citrobacter freundii]MEB2478120.1 hypothetical protein [Citrobacter freundii]